MLLQKINVFIFLMQEKTLVKMRTKHVTEHFDFGLYGDVDNGNNYNATKVESNLLMLIIVMS